MPYSAGTVTVGTDATAVCAVPEAGVMVKNTGRARLFLGGPGDDTAGYPLDPGEKESIPGVKPKETPVVPAPEGDLDPAVLYARCDKGTKGAKGQIAFITVS